MRRRGFSFRSGFTLIEVLVSIAIMSMLTVLLVPSIDRSLSRNNLANDVDLLRSKLEETRLLAGSTQQVETQSPGYYALVIPTGRPTYFLIIRVQDSTGTACPITQAVNDDACLVEKVSLSKGVEITNNEVGSYKLALFRSPTQQASAASCRVGGRNGLLCSAANGPPIFSGWNIQLNFKAKTATVNLEDYTAKMTATYGGTQ